MAISTILVVLSGEAGDDIRLKEAVTLGQAHDATVAAPHVKPPPQTMRASMVELQQEYIDKAAAECERTVKTFIDKTGAAIE